MRYCYILVIMTNAVNNIVVTDHSALEATLPISSLWRLFPLESVLIIEKSAPVESSSDAWRHRWEKRHPPQKNAFYTAYGTMLQKEREKRFDGNAFAVLAVFFAIFAVSFAIFAGFLKVRAVFFLRKT